jgi:hypothetical protein
MMMSVHHAQLWFGEGVESVTSEQGETAVTRAWILSAAGIALFLLSNVVAAVLGELSAISSPKSRWVEIFFSIATLRYQSLYLFQPWMFPGALDLPGLIIASLLTYFVYRRSRIAAVLLLSVYVLIRAFAYIWLYVFSDLFIFIWLAVSLIWGYVFFQGARGTFAHHKGRRMAPSGIGKV